MQNHSAQNVQHLHNFQQFDATLRKFYLDNTQCCAYNLLVVANSCYYLLICIIATCGKYVNSQVARKRKNGNGGILMKTFSEKVKERRGALNISQQQLAEQSGIGKRTIGTYENGERFPHPAQLYKLAKALGVSTEYLKNDEIDDPAYGLDRMDYVEQVRQVAGTKESLDLETMLAQNVAMFAGGTVSEAAKDAYFQAVMKAYVECKQAAKETYGRKKTVKK
jgi:transcriptional regulator with XRE-family HTH domain